MYAFEHAGQGWIKVGMTNVPSRGYCYQRIQNYATMRNLPLDGWKLLDVIKTSEPLALERKMHAKLRQYRVQLDDGDSELFRCDVARYRDALGSLAQYIEAKQPYTTARALARTRALRKQAARNNRNRQNLLAKRKEAEAAEQRRKVEREREDDLRRKQSQRAALLERIAGAKADIAKPRFFNFGRKSREDYLAGLLRELAELEPKIAELARS
jgi:hypothetical protein